MAKLERIYKERRKRGEKFTGDFKVSTFSEKSRDVEIYLQRDEQVPLCSSERLQNTNREVNKNTDFLVNRNNKPIYYNVENQTDRVIYGSVRDSQDSKQP